jgi:hypothetical protein
LLFILSPSWLHVLHGSVTLPLLLEDFPLCIRPVLPALTRNQMTVHTHPTTEPGPP